LLFFLGRFCRFPHVEPDYRRGSRICCLYSGRSYRSFPPVRPRRSSRVLYRRIRRPPPTLRRFVRDRTRQTTDRGGHRRFDSSTRVFDSGRATPRPAPLNVSSERPGPDHVQPLRSPVSVIAAGAPPPYYRPAPARTRNPDLRPNRHPTAPDGHDGTRTRDSNPPLPRPSTDRPGGGAQGFLVFDCRCRRSQGF